MKRWILFVTIAVFFAASNAAFATLTMTTFHSEALNADRSVLVYTPVDYDENREDGYPVYIFLHGATSSPATFNNPFLNAGLNNLMNETIEPALVIIPDGSTPDYWAGSFYTNSELYGDIEDSITDDLIPWIDATYNTNATPEQRAIMGHSMGGYGAMRLGMTHQGLFCGIAAHSGPVDVNGLMTIMPQILTENDPNNSGAPYTYTPDLATRPITTLAFSMAGAWSPNLSNTPPVNFILDENGNIIEDIKTQWQTNMPSTFPGTINTIIEIPIYFDCGTQDELSVYPTNLAFADSLDAHTIDYRFESYEGGHSDQLMTRLPISLAFLNEQMSEPSDVEEIDSNFVPRDFALATSYPNPFNATTNVRFSIAARQHVRVSVVDLLGRVTETLHNGELNAGTHMLPWHPETGTASGVYFVRLESETNAATIRVHLLK